MNLSLSQASQKIVIKLNRVISLWTKFALVFKAMVGFIHFFFSHFVSLKIAIKPKEVHRLKIWFLPILVSRDKRRSRKLNVCLTNRVNYILNDSSRSFFKSDLSRFFHIFHSTHGQENRRVSLEKSERSSGFPDQLDSIVYFGCY